MKKTFFSILFLTLCFQHEEVAFAYQQKSTFAYRIDAQITGLNRSDKVYLEKCVNSVFSIIDSTYSDAQGQFTFLGLTPLESGMYCLSPADYDNVSLGIFISDKASLHFSISYDMAQGLSSFKVENSPENQFFAEASYFTYQQEVAIYEMQEKMKRFVQTHKRDVGIDTLWGMQFQLDSISNSIVEKRKEGIEKFKGSTLALFYQSLQQPIPPNPEFPPSVTDIEAAYQEYYSDFYKHHYFDNINFKDARTLRISLLMDMMNSYFQHVIPFGVETMKEGCDILFEKARANQEIYDFVTSNRHDFFKQAPYPELDAVTRYIAEKYIINRKAGFSDIAFASRLEYQLKMEKLNQVGEPIEDIMWQDSTGKNISIYDIEAPYTVLLFYSPDCHACTIISPMVWDVYTKYRDKGLKVAALYLNTDKELWTSYIDEHQYNWTNLWKPEEHEQLREHFNIHQTPLIYLLDKDKKVVYKDIYVDALDNELSRLL